MKEEERMDDKDEQDDNLEIMDEQLSDAEFERKVEAAEERVNKIQDETASIKRGTLKMWKELEKVEKRKKLKALEKHREARNRLDRAKPTSPLRYRASTSSGGQTQGQSAQRRSKEILQSKKSDILEKQTEKQTEQQEEREKYVQRKELANRDNKLKRYEEERRETSRDRSPLQSKRSSSSERGRKIKREKKEVPKKEKVDRKALFAIKNSTLYRERGGGGKFQPRSQPKEQSRPAATSTPKVMLKRCAIKSIEKIVNAPRVIERKETTTSKFRQPIRSKFKNYRKKHKGQVETTVISSSETSSQYSRHPEMTEA